MRDNLRTTGSKVIILLGVLMLMACSSTMTSAQTVPSGANRSVAETTIATSYPIVDTEQTHCYNNTGQTICPQTGAAFFGQDAQYVGNAPSYKNNGDGTISDLNTGLMWQKSPGSKVSYANAIAGAKSLNLDGYTDWRLPTIKELYSLIDFSGTDPSVNSNETKSLTPFINTRFFDFKYGDTSAGERVIDAQYWSSTEYVSTTMNNSATVFGVNFADGRIKGYGKTSPRGEMLEFVRYVRGGSNYGVNSFVNNGNGTLTDNATGLQWSQADSGKGMNWEAALAWAQAKNTEKYLGYNDWRLPNAKELQSIVDYTRSPDTTGSAAIAPVFTATAITNELGKTDYPFYWTSTTHTSSNGSGTAAVYIAFGRAMGYMNGAWMDVHGAGAQRSDPKSDSASSYPQGRGPQGDSIHIDNYVRLVRGGNVTFTTDTPGVTVTPVAPGAQQPQPGQGQLPANQNASANNRTGGRVTAVSSNTISVENPEGRASIVTNANTKFTANGQASNLANVTVGKFIEVVGQKQTDGSWLATQVNISTSPPIPLGQQPGQGQPPMGGNPPARK